MNPLLLLLFAIVVEGKVGFLTYYGNYCGADHGSDTGIMPIDMLDRYCQIHDLCVGTRSYTSCYCNMQLYWNVWDYTTTSDAARLEQLEIETAMAVATFGCADFGKEAYTALAMTDTYGYNYIPFYSLMAEESVDIKVTALYSGIRYYLSDRSDDLSSEVSERASQASELPQYEMLCMSLRWGKTLVVVNTIPGYTNYISISHNLSYVWIPSNNESIIFWKHWHEPRHCYVTENPAPTTELATWVIAMIAIGAVIVPASIVLIIVMLVKKRRRTLEHAGTTQFELITASIPPDEAPPPEKILVI